MEQKIISSSTVPQQEIRWHPFVKALASVTATLMLYGAAPLMLSVLPGCNQQDIWSVVEKTEEKKYPTKNIARTVTINTIPEAAISVVPSKAEYADGDIVDIFVSLNDEYFYKDPGIDINGSPYAGPVVSGYVINGDTVLAPTVVPKAWNVIVTTDLSAGSDVNSVFLKAVNSAPFYVLAGFDVPVSSTGQLHKWEGDPVLFPQFLTDINAGMGASGLYFDVDSFDKVYVAYKANDGFAYIVQSDMGSWSQLSAGPASSGMISGRPRMKLPPAGLYPAAAYWLSGSGIYYREWDGSSFTAQESVLPTSMMLNTDYDLTFTPSGEAVILSNNFNAPAFGKAVWRERPGVWNYIGSDAGMSLGEGTLFQAVVRADGARFAHYKDASDTFYYIKTFSAPNWVDVAAFNSLVNYGQPIINNDDNAHFVFLAMSGSNLVNLYRIQGASFVSAPHSTGIVSYQVKEFMAALDSFTKTFYLIMVGQDNRVRVVKLD